MSKEALDDLARFLALRKHRRMNIYKEEKGVATSYFWSAGHDNLEEGTFVNWYTNIPMPYLPWERNRPYADGTSYNYLMTEIHFRPDDASDAFEVKSKDYSEKSTKDGPYPVCEIPSKTLVLKLRGLCPEFSFGREFLYTISQDGQEHFQGKTSNAILQFNLTESQWQLYDKKDKQRMITSAAERHSFMLGLQQVTFLKAKDDPCSKDSLAQKIKFTACKDGFFTCSDGHCIPMRKRCDQTRHCKDESDEQDCRIIVMKNYNRNIAPFIVDPLNDTLTPVDINVSATIIDILKINEVEQSFEVKFKLVMGWYDYRLVYHNLKVNRIANSPVFAEVKELWIPNIIFDNTRNNDVMTLDNLADVTISREGDPEPSDITVVDEIDIFKGSENSLTFDKGFTKELQCDFQLQLYPFDTQICTINLQVKINILTACKDSSITGRRVQENDNEVNSKDNSYEK